MLTWDEIKFIDLFYTSNPVRLKENASLVEHNSEDLSQALVLKDFHKQSQDITFEWVERAKKSYEEILR